MGEACKARRAGSGERLPASPSFLGAIAIAACLVVGFGGAVTLGQGVGGTATPVAAMASPTSSPDASQRVVVSQGGVRIPIEDINPYGRCLLDNGFYIGEVHLSPVPGATPFYAYGFTIGEDEAIEIAHACRDKYAPQHEPTEDEIREVYARWVDERECLIRLGYQPQEPPSVETFIQTYHTGPWMPIDGTGYTTWTYEEYSTAKIECGLEMYDR